MAHHLAETMLAAESASGARKVKLEKDAVALILKLWLHRRALPERVDPLSGCREAIKILKLLQPDADPWSRISQQRNIPDVRVMSELFDAMSRAMVGALALTHIKYFTGQTDIKVAHLDPAEQAILDAFDQWLPMVDKSPQPPTIVIVDASKPEEVLEAASEAEERIPDEEKFAEEMQLMLGKSLRSLHTQLGNLITRWEANQVSTL